MATQNAVATALATRLRTISGLDVHEEPVGKVIPPAVLIDTPDEWEPLNLPETEFMEVYNLQLIVDDKDAITAHQTLRAFLSKDGSQSIRAALMADDTLGGVVQTLIIRAPQAVGTITTEDDNPFTGAIIPVEVWN